MPKERFAHSFSFSFPAAFPFHKAANSLFTFLFRLRLSRNRPFCFPYAFSSGKGYKRNYPLGTASYTPAISFILLFPWRALQSGSDAFLSFSIFPIGACRLGQLSYSLKRERYLFSFPFFILFPWSASAREKELRKREVAQEGFNFKTQADHQAFRKAQRKGRENRLLFLAQRIICAVG